MRKFMAIALAAALALVLAGCTRGIEHTDERQFEDGRFVSDSNISGYVVTDTETGVQYLYVGRGYGGGMTVLVDADGKPIVKEER